MFVLELLWQQRRANVLASLHLAVVTLLFDFS